MMRSGGLSWRARPGCRRRRFRHRRRRRRGLVAFGDIILIGQARARAPVNAAEPAGRAFRRSIIVVLLTVIAVSPFARAFAAGSMISARGRVGRRQFRDLASRDRAGALDRGDRLGALGRRSTGVWRASAALAVLLEARRAAPFSRGALALSPRGGREARPVRDLVVVIVGHGESCDEAVKPLPDSVAPWRIDLVALAENSKRLRQLGQYRRRDPRVGQRRVQDVEKMRAIDLRRDVGARRCALALLRAPLRRANAAPRPASARRSRAHAPLERGVHCGGVNRPLPYRQARLDAQLAILALSLLARPRPRLRDASGR